jgi:hypothetical protein
VFRQFSGLPSHLGRAVVPAHHYCGGIHFVLLKRGAVGGSEKGVPRHVRLQSVRRGFPTRKGRGQAGDDAIQQLHNARFCCSRRTKRRRMPSSWHRGCVREGGRVEAVRVWPFSQEPNGW